MAFRGLKCAIPALGAAVRASRASPVFRTAAPFAARSDLCCPIPYRWWVMGVGSGDEA